ncbi:hypothetical protein B0H12DRAFT_1246603 [Mycena haematopus]|nr:hypothetical protein B0H12DRAFT_1246603 [Mycena haematopus]
MSSSATIIERARARREHQELRDREHSQSSMPAPDAPRSSSPPPVDMLASPNLFAPMPLCRTTQNTPAEMGIMKNTGERALKNRKLNNDAQSDFRRFLETSHPLEREALHQLAILEVRALLQDNTEQRQQRWEPSKELSKTIRAFLVMPNLQYYGGSLSATIIEVMRKSGVPGLPEDDALLKDCLSHPLSVDKNTIKSTLKKSMNTEIEEERNIAYVTAKILSSFGVPVEPTLSLYYRFALIIRDISLISVKCSSFFIQRTELAKHHSNETFWMEVDKVLEEFHKEENFKDDMSKYGDPAKTDFKLAANAVAANAPKWLKNVHDFAPKVRRLDTGFKGRKRRRIQDAEDEEEPGHGEDGNSSTNGGGVTGGNNEGSDSNSGEPEPEP